uniref:Katanin p80 subunit C-terminal domain-containing protein n=1 Tax=Oryza nivara TaxID=4536 RepID=A0A0E0FMM2_ORYNI
MTGEAELWWLARAAIPALVAHMMRHVFDQNGIKGAVAAVAKLPDNAVSISQDARKLDLFNLDIFLSFLPVLAGLLTSKAER